MPENNPHYALYTKLREQGLYTRPYGDFRKQFAGKERVAVLFSAMNKDGHYTKTADEFNNQFFKPEFTQDDSPDFSSIKIEDKRDIDNVTGRKVSDTSRLSATADMSMLKNIIQKAKANGVDPYTALAIAHQETRFNPEYDDNPFNLLSTDPEIGNKDIYDVAMKELVNKYKIAKNLGKTTEADQIQAWNGYGKVGRSSFGKDTNNVYGVDVTKNPVDMNKTPLYGQRVIDIRDNILKKNPDIVKLVNEVNADNTQQGGNGSLNLPPK